jgi:hypothetical protein
VRNVDAFGAQRGERGVTDRIGREPAGEAGAVTEVGERDRDVGFATAEGRTEQGRLEEALEARRREAEHQLAESEDGGWLELLRLPHRVSACSSHSATQRWSGSS